MTRPARRNPVAMLLAVAVLMLGLLLTLDLVTPAALLAVELAALPVAGLPLRALARRGWPLLVAVVGVALANALGGASAAACAAVALRVVAVALPGIVVAATTDPVELADSLVVQARVPARFAYGALAALRLLPLLTREWDTLGRARRARGLDAGRNPLVAMRLFTSRAFALVVAAVRRGVRLSLAMDARGFDGRSPRTMARRPVVRTCDRLLVLGALLAVAAATALSVALGTWHLVLT